MRLSPPPPWGICAGFSPDVVLVFPLSSSHCALFPVPQQCILGLLYHFVSYLYPIMSSISSVLATLHLLFPRIFSQPLLFDVLEILKGRKVGGVVQSGTIGKGREEDLN